MTASNADIRSHNQPPPIQPVEMEDRAAIPGRIDLLGLWRMPFSGRPHCSAHSFLFIDSAKRLVQAYPLIFSRGRLSLFNALYDEDGIWDIGIMNGSNYFIKYHLNFSLNLTPEIQHELHEVNIIYITKVLEHCFVRHCWLHHLH